MVDPEFERMLCRSLQIMEENLKAAESEQLPRDRAITALRAVIEFINSVPRLESQNLALTLAQLLGALHDLNYGRVGPMVAPKDFGNRPPESSWRKVVKAIVVWGVDQLHVAGMKLDDAYKFMAAELDRSNISSGGQTATPTWKTIKNWRYDVRKRPPNDQERHALEAWLVEARFPDDIALDQLKTLLSRHLRVILPRAYNGSE
jgi:hypothetical protein